MTMERDEMIAGFIEFIRSYADSEGRKVYMNKINDLLTIVPKKSLEINWAHLNSINSALAQELIENPDEALLAAEDAIRVVLEQDFGEEMSLNPRFYNLPETLLVKGISAEHINRLIQVDGIITRISEVKPFVEKAVFVCRDCGHEMVRLQKPYAPMVKPPRCENCGSRNLDIDIEKSRFMNLQTFRLQDRPESLKGGQMPRFVDAILLDDLVDVSLPGDRVIVTGVLRIIMDSKDKRPIFRKILEVNHIEHISKDVEELEISPEDEQKIRELARRKDIVDTIVDSIAPAIWGHEKVKKGIALALFGGVHRALPDGTKLRGESHVLLVGDPGVAKCVDYHTRVLLAEGGLREIGEVIEEAIERAKVEGTLGRVDDGFYAPIDLELYALDARTLKVRKVRANIAWKRRAPEKMYLIRTASGREIRVTPTHPFFTFENGQFRTRKAEELRVGDFIATPRRDNEPKIVPETEDESLRKLLEESDIFWDRVVEIEAYEPEHGWVYDLQVPEHHNFIANDIFVHNSQILRYVANLAPRAIYTSGKSSSAAGLCVAPDSLVVSDSGIHQIGPFTEDWIKDISSIQHSEGVEYSPYLGESLSTEGGKIKTAPLSRVWKLKAPKELVKIKTITGKELTLTPETRLLTIQDGEPRWTEARNLTKGDYVATLRDLMVEEKQIPVLELLRDLDDLVVYGIKEQVKGLIDEVTRKLGISKRELAKMLGVSESMLYHNWTNPKARGNIKIKHLRKLIELADWDWSRVEAEAVSLQAGTKLRLPKYLDERLAYFAGLVAGDGSVSKAGWGVAIRFSNKNPEMRHKFAELAEDLFGITVTEQVKDGVPSLRFHSKVVSHLLEKLGVPQSPKSSKLDISNELLTPPKSVLASYIRGLFDCDGTVVIREKGSSYVEFDTTSERLAKKLQLALLRFGIVAHLRRRKRAGYTSKFGDKEITSRYDRWELKIYGENVLKFAMEIGFEHPEKARKLDALVEKMRGQKYDTNVDVVPGVGKLIREIRTFYGLSVEKVYGSNFGTLVEKGKPISRKALLKVVENLSKAKLEESLVELPESLRIVIGKALKPEELGMTYKEFYELFLRKRPRRFEFGLLVEIARVLERKDKSLHSQLIWLLSEHCAREEDVKAKLEKLKALATSDLLWEKVRLVEKIESPYDHVYDLTVEGSHSFIANGFVVHNTAAAVRDELTGSWVLEAGVLVLADGGFACLHPNSRVLVDGKYVRIEDLFELEKSYKAFSDGQVVDIQEKEMEVTALDLGSMKTKTSKATIIRRKPWKGELLRLKFRSGNEVTLTPDHLLIDGQTLEWKEAERFKVGESVIGLDDKSNPRPDEIVSIERVPYEGYVYDLYVPGEHNFLAEGIVVHNCIDEFDKMSDRDRSAIHEALEQQSYHHDFELLLADGRKVKIGELVDSLIEANRDKVIIGKDTEILPVDDIELLAYDLERKEIVKVKADRVSRHKAPDKFIRLRFSNGREITVTPEHPIMVWEDGEIREKPAERITRDDVVLGVSKYPIGLPAPEGKTLKDLETAWARQDYLYSQGVVSRIRKDSNRYQAVPVERTFPGELLKKIGEAGRGLRFKLSRRYYARKPVVGENVVRKEIKRFRKHLNLVRKLLDEDPLGVLDYVNKSRITYKYGLSSPTFINRLKRGDPLIRSVLKTEVARSIENAERVLDEVEELLSSNVNFLTVKEVWEIPNEGWEWVYDVTVEPYHLFVSHGLVLHNTISISKAGITATLNARTTVLAAANPKYGRFNRTKPLPEQLELPPTLISRFDLIFVLLDEPDEETDAAIAEHILKVRRGEKEVVTPKVPYDLLKKYIAYARRNVHPVLSKEAMDEIKRYYVKMRKRRPKTEGEEEVKPMPITARQLEALIRLSEAHARMRLSDVVTREDAKAAIDLVEYTLKQVARDESGELDVSILEVGKSSKQINKIERVIGIIKRLERESQYGAAIDDIIKEATEKGMNKDEVRRIVERLFNEGQIYSPRDGYYRVA